VAVLQPDAAWRVDPADRSLPSRPLADFLVKAIA
jgi:hypothetical protein